MELHRWPLDFLYSCTPERLLFMRLRQKRDEHIVCPRMKIHECYGSNPPGFMSMSVRHSLSGVPMSKQSGRKVPGPVWQVCLKGFGFDSRAPQSLPTCGQQLGAKQCEYLSLFLQIPGSCGRGRTSWGGHWILPYALRKEDLVCPRCPTLLEPPREGPKYGGSEQTMCNSPRARHRG